MEIHSPEITEKIDFSSVLASMVHDMKNSLSLLINNIENITETCTMADCQNANKFAQLGHEAKRVNNHLVQLLALYKMDCAQFYVNIDHNEVADFLIDARLQNESLLAANGIRIDIECATELQWFFDMSLVGGVLNNVINNANRYAKSRILLKAETCANFLKLSVEDDGEGYPPNLCHRQGKPVSSVDFKTGSTGLGLYFSYQIARLHKNKTRYGEIALSNGGSLGGGCFSLLLP